MEKKLAQVITAAELPTTFVLAFTHFYLVRPGERDERSLVYDTFKVAQVANPKMNAIQRPRAPLFIEVEGPINRDLAEGYMRLIHSMFARQ